MSVLVFLTKYVGLYFAIAIPIGAAVMGLGVLVAGPAVMTNGLFGILAVAVFPAALISSMWAAGRET